VEPRIAPRLDRYRAALLVLALALAPLTTLRLYGSDEIQYFAYLRSAVFDHDLDFTNEYRWFVDRDPQEYEGFATTFLGPKTPAGRHPNNGPIGSALLWSPLYLATVGVEQVFGASGTPPGYSRADFAAVCIASMILGVLGLLVTNEACRRFSSPASAFWATGLVWLATNLPFYMYVTPPMSHAASFFAAALLLLAWLRCEETPRAGFMIGLLGGLVASVRWQDALLLAAPLSAPLWPRRQARGSRRLAAAWSVAIFAGFLLAFLPQLFVWRILNGSVTPFGVISLSGRFRFTAPYLPGVLFSPFHGLLLWTPVLVPAFLGLGALAVTDHRGKAMALAVVLEIYMISGYAVAFGQSFGQRLFISSLPFAAVGLAVFGERMAPRLPRSLVIAGGLAAVWWNTSLMVQYATGMIPRNEGVTLGRLLENQVVGVPRRLPDVVGRYLFDRRSLYHVDPTQPRGGEPPADDRERGS
jgi:hypothetical protein